MKFTLKKYYKKNNLIYYLKQKNDYFNLYIFDENYVLVNKIKKLNKKNILICINSDKTIIGLTKNNIIHIFIYDSNFKLKCTHFINHQDLIYIDYYLDDNNTLYLILLTNKNLNYFQNYIKYPNVLSIYNINNNVFKFINNLEIFPFYNIKIIKKNKFNFYIYCGIKKLKYYYIFKFENNKLSIHYIYRFNLTIRNILKNNHDNNFVNSSCICKGRLTFYKKNLLTIFPCQHIIHEHCINEKVDKCPFCNIKIDKILKKNKLKKKYYQNYINLLSTTNTNHYSDYNIFFLFKRFKNIIKLCDILLDDTINNKEQGMDITKQLFTTCNIELYMNNELKENYNNHVIISNHNSFLDCFILYYLFKGTFTASDKILNNVFCRLICKPISITFFKRGIDINIIDKFKDINTPLIIFPEGIISNPDTLVKFRSGAFVLNKPVVPVVLSYYPQVHDTNMYIFILKLLTQKKISIHVQILPTEYPPFDNLKIENIRNKMSIHNKMIESNISSKDIKDI